MTERSVSVAVPARLHLGFLDLDGTLGRRFGSLGMALDGPSTRLELRAGRGLTAQGPDAQRAAVHLRRVTRHFGSPENLHLDIKEVIPAHGGLGSGTQLALAVGTAVCRYHGQQASPRELARLLDRGARSGVGLGAFEQGGVLLDGGRGPGDDPPPIVSRLPFPAQWRVLLVMDHGREGMHGCAEVAAFQDLPPFPEADAGRFCRLVLMQALPALAEGDLTRFGAAVTEIQETIGDYFAPAQGGRYSSPKVAEVLSWLGGEGVTGLGQSSWGPTGFALIGTERRALSLRDEARRRWPVGSGLSFRVCRGRNSPARVGIDALARAELQAQ